MKNKCAILVCSCDSYEEAWTPFFHLFRKYWTNCKFPIYLNTESKSYNKYEVETIMSQKGSWTERLHRVLEKIDAEYVLIFLEDFFFQRPVKVEKFNSVLEEMDKNKQIAVFYFNKITGYNDDSKYKDYYIMKPKNNNQYMCNCQLALWRKDVLLDATNHSMSAWEFEDNGYNYLSSEKREMEYYCTSLKFYIPITVFLTVNTASTVPPTTYRG